MQEDLEQKGRIIMGIDPGFGRMGFGVIYVEGMSSALIDYGVITTTTGDEFPNRLLHIANDLQDLFMHHKPNVVAIEKLFFGKSTTTAMRVAEARGVALLVSAQAGVSVCEFTPAQVKKATTGDGTATKLGMQKMVMKLLGLDRIPKPDDAADALAIALTAVGAISRHV
ncbi:MAG: crossover junction endodeoxyribonuclease RuvC [Patescibacteria group bacterium]